MIDLKAILEYQEADIRLRKMQDSIEKSEAQRRGKQAKIEFDAAKKRVDDSEAQAGEILDFIKNADETADKARSVVSEYKEKIDEKMSAEERKTIRAELEALKAKLSESEKRVDSKLKRASKVVDESRESQARAKKMRDVFLKEKEAYDKLKKSKEPEIAELKKQLALLREKVDPQLVKQYDELSADRKIPAFVDAFKSESGTYSCRGCGLQLSQADNGKLERDGICRCGNCRRIIYNRKKN
ncbi:MAG: hypothetical protein HFK09_06145 [Clostridia bacterium]|nr:hypothetical protein [Clostridia bacterium]